jgi:O-methyltransferase involved in polyketide biosynthesis
MSDDPIQKLGGVAETLLFPLYFRALETRRPDALLKDENAVTLIAQINHDFSHFKFDSEDQVTIILRNREFDRRARDFLARHPQAVVVHLGCGLDTRFERVDNGRVEWYDLDLPEVIELRKQLIGGEKERYHLLACSLLAEDWPAMLGVHRQASFLFLAEGVFMYFREAQVKALLFSLQRHFPGAELVFDTQSPYVIWANNIRYARSKVATRFHWGLTRGKDLESWGKGIHFLDEWFIFDHPEPRLAHIRWMRHIPALAKAMGIFHYRLGNDNP